MELLILLVVSLGVFWSLSAYLDKFFDEKQCPHCGEWSNARHMIEFRPLGKPDHVEYWHQGCFLMKRVPQSPPSDSK
jgi:hypothetical protein